MSVAGSYHWMMPPFQRMIRSCSPKPGRTPRSTRFPGMGGSGRIPWGAESM